MIIIALISGMMGGGAISLYVVPQALFTWLGIITFGCAAGLIASATAVDYFVLGLLTVYSCALFKAGHSISHTYIRNHISGFEIKEQSATISILLKEYAENASDWLWEMDNNAQLTRGRSNFATALKTGAGIYADSDADVSSKKFVLSKRSVKPLWRNFKNRESFRDLMIMSKAAGETRWVSVSGKPVFDGDDEFTGFRGVASDVTEAKLAEERIAFLAHNDALTGLVNRAEFSRVLKEKIANHQTGDKWSVLYLDLDGFKNVNDQYGHSVGDDLLGQVALRLKNKVGAKDTVARLGGDEFAVLCVSCKSLQSISNLADNLVAELSEPFQSENGQLEVGVSIGIALGGQDGNDSFALLNNADLALYRAKADGKGTYRFYEQEMDEIIKERRSLENDLRIAIRNQEISVSYQPLISAETGKTTGFEALARWTHPTRGLIPPADFIPVAERAGIIVEIGEWVLKTACLDAMQWPDDLTVAVNLSPQQFKSSDIVDTVRKSLKESGLEAERLELEITEGLFMDSTDEVIAALTEMKALGISVAMDDFGTGYSSLSYILKFPFDKLKIDRSFISSIENDAMAKNILEAITKLGDMLNLKVTAEGVETSDQAELLQDMPCTRFQGYYFGKPLPQAELAGYLLNEFRDDRIGTSVEDAAVAEAASIVD